MTTTRNRTATVASPTSADQRAGASPTSRIATWSVAATSIAGRTPAGSSLVDMTGPATTGTGAFRHEQHASRPFVTESGAVRGAGYGFVAAWLVGLAVNPSGTAIDATDAEVARHYATHAGAALTSELLIHGVAAIALAIVVAGVVRFARRTHRPHRLYATAGFAAAAVSGLQVVAGVAAVAATNATTVATLFDAVNRLDGVKLLLLAAAALAAIRIVGGWAARVTVPLVLTLGIGGIGYALLDPALAVAAAPALLLLLVWVASSARTASR